MKIRDLVILAHKNNQKISKKYIFITVIVLIFLLIFIPFSLYITFMKEANRSINQQNDFKIIKVHEQFDIKNLNLENNEHVVKVKYFPYFRFLVTSVQGLNSEDNSIYDTDKIAIEPNYQNYGPRVQNGKSISKTNDIVCPYKMAYGAFDNKSINEFIDMEKYLNQEIEIIFSKIVYNEITKEDEIENYPYKFNLVGTYDASYSFSYNTCYIHEDAYEDIEQKMHPYSFDNYYKENYIYVDKVQNVDKITKILAENGIDYFVSSIDISFVYTILDVAQILTIMLVIFSIIILSMYMKIYIKERSKNLALYNALGFNNKNIRQILFMGVFELLLQAFIISIIIVLVIKYVIVLLFHNSTSFKGVSIVISFLPPVLYIIVVMLLFYFVIWYQVKKLNNKSVKEFIER